MSDTDWSVWEEMPKKSEDMVDNESNVLFETEINDLAEYEFIKIIDYFDFKQRVVLSSVCQKWRQLVEKSFKSETILNSSTIGSNNNFSEKALCLMIRKCSNVRHISLKGMFLFKSSETTTEEELNSSDNILFTIVSNCHRLESIDFGSFDQFEPFFESYVKYFSQLKTFISKNIGEKAFNCIIDSQNLETIDISRNDKISRPELRRLGPKMTELHLIDSEVVDVCVIKDLCDGNGNQIKVLSIDIKDSLVLSLICKNLIKLKSFKLCLYSKDCDFKQFSQLIGLNSLEIEVMDESMFRAEQFTDLVRSLRTSNLLYLRTVFPPTNNIAINDQSLQEIRDNCQTIQKIVIRGANSLTGAGMYSIAKLQALTHLDLKDCLNITDNIDIVITSCPLLRQLILHNCSHITKSTADAFIKKAKTLPKEQFYLDVVDTSVSRESLPLEEERPKNLKLLFHFEDCIYDCDHGWDQQNGYNSGPEDDLHDLIQDCDFYDEIDDNEYYDEYDDEDIDYEFS